MFRCDTCSTLMRRLCLHYICATCCWVICSAVPGRSLCACHPPERSRLYYCEMSAIIQSASWNATFYSTAFSESHYKGQQHRYFKIIQTTSYIVIDPFHTDNGVSHSGVRGRLLQLQFIRVKSKGWTCIVRLSEVKTDRFPVNRQVQDMWDTDGFLLQPFHIFSSFFELYDTVFHKPETQSTTR